MELELENQSSQISNNGKKNQNNVHSNDDDASRSRWEETRNETDDLNHQRNRRDRVRDGIKENGYDFRS